MKKLSNIFLTIAVILSGVVFILIYKDFYRVRQFVDNHLKSRSPQMKSPMDDQVTRIIHQSWKDNNVPQFMRNYSLSWTDHCYKDWKYMFWTDQNNLDFIKIHYPWFMEKYLALPLNINRADVSRYFYLFHYGGIYTDLDNECLRPFDHLLSNYSLVFGAMEGQFGGTTLQEGYVQNSFMYSKPRHEFWMNMIIAILNGRNTYSPEGSTGPILLSNQIQAYRKRVNMSNDIKIYPPDYFNPFSWIIKAHTDPNCKDFNQMNFEELSKCRQSMIKRGSYVVQYHAHTW